MQLDSGSVTAKRLWGKLDVLSAISGHQRVAHWIPSRFSLVPSHFQGPGMA
jgi:hypothetical protein